MILMSKLLDNELNDLWLMSGKKEDKTLNKEFENFLKKAGIYEIRKAEVMSTRVIDDLNYIILTHKTITEDNFIEQIYCIVVINKIKDLLDIIKYSRIKNINFDVFEVITNHKLTEFINNITNNIDSQLDEFVNNNFSYINHRLTKALSLQLLIKPDKHNTRIKSATNITKTENVNTIKTNIEENINTNSNKNELNNFKLESIQNNNTLNCFNSFEEIDYSNTEDKIEDKTENKTEKSNFNISSDFIIKEPVELTDIDDFVESLTMTSLNSISKSKTNTKNNILRL